MKKIKAYTASWCGPCKMLKPILKKMETEGLINIEYFDIDEKRDEAIKEGIKGVPTLIYLNDGEEYKRTTGFMPEVKILENYNEVK